VVVAVFGDAHGHAEALDAVLAAAERHGVDELWSLGDMCGCGPDAEYVIARTRAACRVAILGNHDYAARDTLPQAEVEWMRTRRPAARRAGVQCWHGSPRNPVHEYVGPRNAAACLERQKEALGLVGHTHLAAAYPAGGKPHRIVPGEPLALSSGKWLLNPGAVGAPIPPRGHWWDQLDAEAGDGAFWLRLDLESRTATWLRAPYDPRPARERARAAGLI
jgi:predicted phosphodiesterase